MFTQINSAGIHGMEGFLVSVESDVSNGLPGFSISGQLALEVREAQERVRTALKNSDLQLPAKKITVNLSPAGMKKEGTAFDLPIAAAVLGAFELLAAEKLRTGVRRQRKTSKGRTGPGIGCQENGISPMLFTSTQYGRRSFSRRDTDHRYKVASSFAGSGISRGF